ncbi:hypothetical protein [Roseixanthobacter pseudopolyaromaticivorans]|uniref:hypothetical protein n=2 Tax=Hyphomicrobiales TaxID=356 RepID=UPI00372709E9
MRTAFFTSASFAYLDRARVLFQTLRVAHPDWEIWMCMVDEEPAGFVFDAEAEGIHHLVWARDLGIPNFLSWAFQHDVVELCTAVKGAMLCRMLDEGIGKVIYLDPDIAVFSPLTEAVDLLGRHSIVLTPHQIDPDTDRAAIMDNEIGSLKYGIFNLGFVAVANTSEGLRFAEWWRDRLLDFCFDDVPGGLFTDQKWCNHVPVFFPSTAILRHKGYNVASWNLSQRKLTISPEGDILSGGDVLRFYHFTKVTHVGMIMIERYSEGETAIFELVKWYKDTLRRHAVQGLPPRWWKYGNYDSGQPISREDRLNHRTAIGAKHAALNPFASEKPLSTA